MPASWSKVDKAHQHKTTFGTPGEGERGFGGPHAFLTLGGIVNLGYPRATESTTLFSPFLKLILSSHVGREVQSACGVNRGTDAPTTVVVNKLSDDIESATRGCQDWGWCR